MKARTLENRRTKDFQQPRHLLLAGQLPQNLVRNDGTGPRDPVAIKGQIAGAQKDGGKTLSAEVYKLQFATAEELVGFWPQMRESGRTGKDKDVWLCPRNLKTAGRSAENLF